MQQQQQQKNMMDEPDPLFFHLLWLHNCEEMSATSDYSFWRVHPSCRRVDIIIIIMIIFCAYLSDYLFTSQFNTFDSSAQFTILEKPSSL
jgi:hypothetical protein